MYEKIGWEDSPSTKTPILAVSLNQMDNGIEKANKGIVFSYSATFTADGVVKSTTSLTSLGAGDFATNQVDIVTAFIASNVTSISSGTFANCISLKTIYIDNTADNINIASGAIPDNTTVVYCNDDNFINVNDILANAIKSLKTKIVTDEEQHKADVQALTDKANQLETQATKDRDTFNNQIENINESLDTKEILSNKVDVITHPSTTTYPSVKGVWDFVETKSEQPLADIEQTKADIAKLKVDKVDNTDFNAYKTSNDTAVKKNATDIAQNATDITAVKADVLKYAIKVTTDKSTSAVINDSSNKNIIGLILYGKSTQSAEPSPDSPVTINHVENPSITLTDDTNSQNIIMQCTLKGIDELTDTLTINSDGTGYITQKLQQLVLQSSDFDNMKENPSGSNTHRCTLSFSSSDWANSSVKYTPLCNILKYFSFASTETFSCFDIRSNTLYVDLGLSLDETKSKLKQCAADNNGVVVIGVRATPITTALSKEEVEKILNLHTYYPRITVIADCDSQLTYIADTKNYIDNKLNEIATALVASASSEEVM